MGDGLPTTMLAAVYHGRGDLRIEEMPVPRPGPGELLLEVHAAGVCGTDASEYAEGPKLYAIGGPHPVTGHEGPLVPGHEFGGRVASLGDGVTGFDPGDLVASGAGISCGECDSCRAGRTNLCARYATVGLQRHGALAHYVAVPAAVCAPVGGLGLTDDGAGIVQPMAVAVHAMRTARPRPGETAFVVGVGGVGAFLVYALAEMGVEVVAADLDEGRLSIAAGLGAADTVLVEPGADSGHPAALTGAVPLVYEVSGTAPGLDAALSVAAPAARVVPVGLHEGPVPVPVRELTLREVELLGTNALVFAADIPEAARLVASRGEGWSDVAPTALPLDRMIPEALEPLAAGSPERIKSLIDPWADETRPTAFA